MFTDRFEKDILLTDLISQRKVRSCHPVRSIRLANSTFLTEEKAKYGAEIRPEVERLIPGGLRTTAHLGQRGNPMEMLREMLLPQAGGADGAAGGGGGSSGNRLENGKPLHRIRVLC